ncbi:hypothetical protein [Paenibacillus sinensis]|nr:hypothetical protein [Paenibacillus sinensis]
MVSTASLILLRVPASGGQVTLVTELTLIGFRMNAVRPASGPVS